jgi:HSP20 family protein
VRRDPELLALRRLALDELLGAAFGRGRSGPRGFTPRVDVYYCGEDDARAVVKVELPGVDPGQVAIEVRGRQLVIAGERPSEAPGTRRLYQQFEIPTGPFRRVVELGADVASDRAEASYEDGILHVEIPLVRPVRPEPRRVPIRSGEPEP